MYVKRNELGLIIDRCGEKQDGFEYLRAVKEKNFYLSDENRKEFNSLAMGSLSEEDQIILKEKIDKL